MILHFFKEVLDLQGFTKDYIDIKFEILINYCKRQQFKFCMNSKGWLIGLPNPPLKATQQLLV